MKCKNCGNRLKRNENFCSVCGFYNGSKNDINWKIDDNDEDNLFEDDFEFKDEDNSDFLEEDKKKDVENSDDFFDYKDELLLEAYIGEDYKIIKKIPFNIYAFILNWFYVLYRKLYITGTIGLVLSAIILMKNVKIFLIYIGICMLVLGFLFNKYFIFIAMKKIDRIKEKYEGTDQFTLQEICEKKGKGTTLYPLLVYAIILIVIIFSYISFSFNMNNNKKFWKENSENKATCNSLVKSAYEDLQENHNIGKILEGTCKKIKSTPIRYVVYLKVTKTDNNTVYLYYSTDNNYLLYQGDTNQINELEGKRLNQTITYEEQKTLNKLKMYQTNYNQIYKKSREEDELIQKKKNTEEKRNYVYSREEIIR